MLLQIIKDNNESCTSIKNPLSFTALVQALPEHGVTTVFVNLSNTKLELLHPLGEKSPIAGFLEKNKSGGIHHICIEVGCSIRSVMKSKLWGERTSPIDIVKSNSFSHLFVL